MRRATFMLATAIALLAGVGGINRETLNESDFQRHRVQRPHRKEALA